MTARYHALAWLLLALGVALQLGLHASPHAILLGHGHGKPCKECH